MAVIESLLSPGTVERVGWALIHFVWQAAATAALLAALLRWLHQRSADARYIASCAAMTLMVALPVATIALVEVSGPAAEVGPAPANLSAAATTPASEVIEVAKLPPLSADEAAPLETAPPALAWHERWPRIFEPALPYLVCGWLLGVLGLSAWHLGGWAQLQRLRRRMVCDVAPALQAKFGALARRIGVQRAVGMLESALVEVPTVVGWVKPVILLPAGALTGLSSQQLEGILAHELAHIRRYDYLVNVLQTVVEILGFYHPAVWWVSRRVRIERENCCDDVAVRICGDSVCYARALTHLEEMRLSGGELAVAATGGSLIVRIGRLVGRPAANERRFAWLPGLLAVLLVAGVVIPGALVLGAADAARAEPVELSRTDARELLHEVIEANRYWLTGPSPEITGYSYDFHLPTWSAARERGEPMRITVAHPAEADGTQRQGIRYRSVLHEIAQRPTIVYIKSAVDEGGRIRLDLEFTERVTIEYGSTMTGLGHGIGGATLRTHTARLWLDPDRRVPLKTTVALNGMSLEEMYSQYVPAAGGRYVPLQIDLVRRGHADEERPWLPNYNYCCLTFSFFEPGLWLFDQSRLTRTTADRIMVDVPVVAFADHVVIDGAARARTGPETRSATSALRANLNELARQGQAAAHLYEFGRALRVYAASHNGRYPVSLAAFEESVAGALPEFMAWVNENVAYLGSALRVAAPGDTPLAYDSSLLNQQAGTNVLFNDMHVAFLPRAELRQTGILRAAELPESPPAVLVKTGDEPAGNSEQRCHIRIDMLAAEVFSDETLDYETALLVRDIVAEALTAAAEPAGRDAAIPTVEQLQAPLHEIIRNYVGALKLTGDETKSLVDVLVQRGYAEVTARPVVMAMDGQEVELVIGGAPATEEDEPPRPDLRVKLTARRGKEPDTVRMETEFWIRRAVVRVENAEFRAESVQFRVPLVARNAEYATFASVERQDESDRLRLPLILLKPTVLPAHESTLPTEPLPGRIPPPPAEVRVMVEPSPGRAAAREQTRVLIDFTVAMVPNDTYLDPETALALGEILGVPIPLDDDTGQSQATLEAIFAEHVAQRPLSDETLQALVHLLDSHGYITTEARPQVLTQDGRETQVNIMAKEYYTPTPTDSLQHTGGSEAQLETIETETRLAVTPYLEDNNENVLLAMNVELCDALPPTAGSSLPVVTRRMVQTTVKIPLGEYFVLPVDAKSGQTPYVMVKATLLPPPRQKTSQQQRRDSVTPERQAAGRRDPVNSDPLLQELAKSIAEVEEDLLTTRQTLAPQHPEVVRKHKLLDALNRLLEERRTELEQESNRQVAGDPLVRELARRIAQIERDLIVARQTLAPNHPEIVQKEQLVAALTEHLKDRRTELQR